MASGDVPPQRSEVVVRGDGNCFWRDEMSDKKNEEIRRLSSALIEKNPKVFLLLLFSSNSAKEHRGGSRGRVQGCAPSPPEMTCGLLIQLVFCKKCGLLVLVRPFLSGATPPKKSPGSAPWNMLRKAKHLQKITRRI